MPIDFFTLLVVHMLCNARAEVDVMPMQEAQVCSENFEKLKLKLHPEYSYKEFRALKPSGRAKVSVEAYQYYTRWIAENSGINAKLKAGASMMASAGFLKFAMNFNYSPHQQ